MNDHRLEPVPGLPPELSALDDELRALRISERPSFAPELRTELARSEPPPPARDLALARRRASAGFSRRWALAAALAGVCWIGLAVPPARASLVELSREVLAAVGVELPPAGTDPAAGPDPDDVSTPTESAGALGLDALEAPSAPAEPAQPRIEEAATPELPVAEPTNSTFPAVLNRDAELRLIQRYYPLDLQQRGIGGRISLRAWVAETGRISDVVVRRASGVEALDSAAVGAASQIRFRPGTRNGEPVGTWVDFDIVFQPLPEAVGEPAGAGAAGGGAGPAPRR